MHLIENLTLHWKTKKLHPVQLPCYLWHHNLLSPWFHQAHPHSDCHSGPLKNVMDSTNDQEGATTT